MLMKMCENGDRGDVLVVKEEQKGKQKGNKGEEWRNDDKEEEYYEEVDSGWKLL